jgi:hypothetical protein
MKRELVWIDDPSSKGWCCANCSWRFPVPTLLSDPAAKAAYDRLASLKFREHTCQADSLPQKQFLDTSTEPTFAVRARNLAKLGYKPKDAVEIALNEIALEHRNDPTVMAQAREEAEDFLRKVRQGLI